MGDKISKLDYKDIAAKAIRQSRENIAADPQLQALMPDMQLYETLRNSEQSCEAMIDQILSAYSDRDAAGMRGYDVVPSADGGGNIRQYREDFTVKTYGELRSEIRAIASSWKNRAEMSLGRDEFLAIIGFASGEFTALDCAAGYAQAVSVPLQSASSGADLGDIFDRIAPACLAASYDDIETAEALAKAHDCLRSVVIFDIDLKVDAERESFEALKSGLAGHDISVVTYGELVAAGQNYEFEFLPPHPDGDERLSLIIHSSGSTGIPKGAMITAGIIKQYWIGSPEKYPTISVIFSPLNHLLGRATLLQTLGKGSTAFFTLAPDMSTLFDDIRIVRPTGLTFFPRVLDMVYQHFQNEVVKAISTGAEPEAARAKVKAQMGGSFLGDRLTAATVGSAPTSQAVKDFMADCFGLAMWDGYGSTEAGAGSVTINGTINRRFVLDYKLRDVPELGYYLTDKPYPRGEFCFRGRNQIKGFYKDPKATAELLTDDGFIITGDIVEEHDNERIVIIDRRKDVVKLSQGEYVAVGPLGTVFEGGSPFIKQIYIYGNSHRAYLVAVIVPDIEAVNASLGKNANDLEIRMVLRQAVQDVAKAEALRSFEAPRDFIIEKSAFSQSNGLLSSVRKKLRPALKRTYETALEALYEKHDQSRDDEIAALKGDASGLSSENRLKRLVIIHLGLGGDITIPSDKNFTELGGDSLGAVNFSLLVEDVFGIVFPADKILDPTASISSWAKDIERLKDTGQNWASFASVHGAESQILQSSDLQLGAFIPEADLANAAELPLAPNAAKTVLLTGATGFLGRHVCLEWLANLSDGSELICLVRAKDNAAAQKRLTDVFEGSERDMREAFHRLSGGKLTVLAADIGMPGFGLDPNDFDSLAQRVDRICHVGALVNHRLSYAHLFAPNVTGTAEIIKLAITHKRKPIDFVSTVSVLPLLDPENPDKENAQLMKTLKLSGAYAFGYAASKWAAETLLRNAANSCKLPVKILRGNMMLAHKNYAGAINPSDMFTRLLYSLIAAGIAPKTFYSGSPVNYDGLPVDLVASSVVNASQVNGKNLAVFNIHNYNTDVSFSLDAITEAIRQSGFEIEVIEVYGDWYQRFSERLHTLPDEQKQKSAIDLLSAFKRPQPSGQHRSYSQFAGLVDALKGELPRLDQGYVRKILDDLSVIKILD